VDGGAISYQVPVKLAVVLAITKKVRRL
jgi:hypothetical protein